MSNYRDSESVLVQRASILSGLEALYVSNHTHGTLMNEGAYEAGFNEGFVHALSAVAHLLGLAGEFRTFAARMGETSACSTVVLDAKRE